MRARGVLLRGATGVGVLAAVLLVTGSSWEWWQRRAAARDYPPPGRLVDIGGRRLQLDCRGTGAPTVVLVSGLDTGGSLAWSAVHDALARTARTCAYSRAGIMWSDPDPAFTPKHVADDLAALLQHAGEAGPFVLVGHSLGGPFSMLVAQHHPALVAGVVFVDASHPDQIARFEQIGMPAELPGLALYRRAATLNWTGLVRFHMGKASPMPGESAALAQIRAAYTPLSIRGAVAEMEALPLILREAGALRSLGARPLVVLTARKPLPVEVRSALGLTEAQAAAQQQEWLAMHDDEASWSTNARHELVEGAGHYIQFDQPAVVIRAVQEVVEQVRNGAPAQVTP